MAEYINGGPCRVPGCVKVSREVGLCSAHYARRLRHGSENVVLPGDVVEGKKLCAMCGQMCPVDMFGHSRSYCRPCQAQRMRQYRSERPRERRGRLVTLSCDCCGCQFVGDGKRSRYCSPECFEAFRNRANWKHVTRRRARLRDALVESFDRLDIFSRDGWVCQICGLAVDREARFPDPNSASLDHIIPIAKGGTHEPANAQCSHLHCNIMKSDRIT